MLGRVQCRCVRYTGVSWAAGRCAGYWRVVETAGASNDIDGAGQSLLPRQCRDQLQQVARKCVADRVHTSLGVTRQNTRGGGRRDRCTTDASS